MMTVPPETSFKWLTLGGSILARIFRMVAFSSTILVFCLFSASCYSAQNSTGQTSVQNGCPDLVDLIKKLGPSVVSITVERSEIPKHLFNGLAPIKNENSDLKGLDGAHDEALSDSLGSGFFCDTEGHIVTNAHVVASAEKILVTLCTGKSFPAKVVATHPRVDLALIKVDTGVQVEKAKIGDSSRIEVGEWVLAVGNPFGLGRTVTVGIVSGKGRFLGLGPDDNFIQTDASINPGNSGGPLFNMVGEVIGVNTAIIASGKGIGFSIPSNYIMELLEQKSSQSSYAKGWLGLYVDDIDKNKAEAFGPTSRYGVVVDDALGAAPAFLAGIRKGDLILSADGKVIHDAKHLASIISNTKPGDTLQLVVVRENVSRKIDVLMGTPPE